MSDWRTEIRAVRAAVMFFTRLPLPLSSAWNPGDLQRAAAYFPFVGWLVGGVAALVWWLGVQVWPPTMASGVSLAATLLLTGAFHEDGWADVCDGFGGGTTKDRVLEIMRDSRVGAFGAIGVAVMLGLKWQSVAALPVALAPAVLMAGHALSRAAAISLMATLPYVREGSAKAKPMATELGGGRLAVALLGGMAPLSLLPLSAAGGALAAVIFARVVLARWFARRIGGYTGDCLGAAQQMTELVFYLTILALA
ncbi:MAG: adenosylcobinamide-GDP ribazoletransferase [Opitutaceae bacterium]|nr:adenosylcobinamide-GDP ribazoletransferase [Opitutaceae bacterium]